MKWFSLEGIMNEIKRIRWPSGSDLFEKTLKTLFFIVLFMLFFIASEFIISYLLRLLGIAA